MDDFLTDQQQAARVRTWLREYAPAAIAALAIGIGGYFGYAQWQARGDRQAAEASELFEELRQVLDSGNPDSAGELHQRLVAEFSGSGYADHARLLMARLYVDTTRPALAAEELSELVASTGDDDLRQLARLRLARVYLYMDRPEEGLDILNAAPPSANWEQLTEDTRGDLYRALGRFEEARSAYQAALERTGQVDPGWIRMKLDYIAGAAVHEPENPEIAESEEADGQEPDAPPSASGQIDAPEADAAAAEPE